MKRRSHLEHQVAGIAPLVRVANGYLEIAPAVLPGSASRFFRGVVPRSVAGVDLLHGGERARLLVEPRCPCPAVGNFMRKGSARAHPFPLIVAARRHDERRDQRQARRGAARG